MYVFIIIIIFFFFHFQIIFSFSLSLSHSVSSKGQFDNYGDYEHEPHVRGDAYQSNESPGSGSQPRASVQTLTQVSIHQLLAATQLASEESFRLDKKELQQVSFIGLILKSEASESVITYEVDDGTGSILVKLWPEKGAPVPQTWREGFYVRVVGHLRSFTDTRSVIAFKLMDVPDLNELTYHFLEVLSIHLQSTRAPTHTEHAAFPSGSAQHIQAVGGAASYAGGDGKMDELSGFVFGLISGVTDPAGAARAYLIANTRSHGVSEQATNPIIQPLSLSCVIFTSIDDNHFKVAAM